MFDNDGYLRVGDFGLSNFFEADNKMNTSGTPAYMAPEILCRQNHSFSSDFYSLGVICYECMLGKLPYTGKTRKDIREKILSSQVQIKKDEIPEGWSLESADFINRLIQRKPINRLGLNGALEVMNHDWLKTFPWEKLKNKGFKNPYFSRLKETYFEPTAENYIDLEEDLVEKKRSSLSLLRVQS